MQVSSAKNEATLYSFVRCRKATLVSSMTLVLQVQEWEYIFWNEQCLRDRGAVCSMLRVVLPPFQNLERVPYMWSQTAAVVPPSCLFLDGLYQSNPTVNWLRPKVHSSGLKDQVKWSIKPRKQTNGSKTCLLFRWFEELGPICELLEKVSKIGVSEIKSPIGSLF